MHEAYEKMGKALKATGRPIVLFALPVRVGCAVGVGAGAGRQPVAHDGRYRAALGQSVYDLMNEQRGWKRSMPGRGTGTIPTCWKWATAS